MGEGLLLLRVDREVKLESRSQKAEKVDLSAEEKSRERAEAASIWTTATWRPLVLGLRFNLCPRPAILAFAYFFDLVVLGLG